VIEHDAIQLALRARLMTLAVSSTGLISLASSATGGEDGASAYIRTTGSFLTDMLRVGLEVATVGFPAAASGVATITHLTPTIATVNRTLPDVVAAGGRSLAVGMPALIAWENVPFDQQEGRPYFEEQYLPGGAPRQRTLGPNGILEVEPIYIINIFVPKGVGISADSKYSNAIAKLFAPGQRINLASPNDLLSVRRDVAPNPAQRQFPDLMPGFVAKQFSIPLRLHTPNFI
jgi:hypothetical protein